MSASAEQDWKEEVLCSMEDFVGSVYKIDEKALEILLTDEGQLNIVWDSIRHLFPENRFTPGDDLTALELGRLIGGFHSLWSAMLANAAYYERLSKAAAETKALRERIDGILAKSAPEAMQGPATGIIHLTEALASPAMVDAVRANRKHFETVIDTVFGFVRAQAPVEFKAFMAGYGAAFAYCPIDVDGLPIGTNRMASMISIFRPFLIKLGYSATDLQACLDAFLPENEAPHSDRLAKYLQRKKAPLRPKGRPSKK